MNPSRSKMPASASFTLEPGIATVSRWVAVALRMRVSMSAIGSVMVMARPPSPARLGHARDLPGVDQLPETDPAEPELAVHRLGAAAPPASRVRPHLELGRALLLLDECLLRH